MSKALVTTLAIVTLAIPPLAHAHDAAIGATAPGYRLSAAMTAKQMTTPRPKGNVANARGSLRGTATIKTSTASWTLTFSGMTGRVTAADIRYPAAGTVSVIRLCAPCVSGTKLTTTFPSKAVAQAFVKQALAGKADVVLKTKRNPRGEVRGVVKARAA